VCELRDDGQPRVDAQFFLNEKMICSRRLATRELAVQWAEEERKAIEGGER
jgi:hypothetical protein